MDTLRAKYARLGAKKSFQNLRNNVRIIATWDDHDYGWNDVGRHYPYKRESKEIFLDFLTSLKTPNAGNTRAFIPLMFLDLKAGKFRLSYWIIEHLETTFCLMK
jgi:hypothetical protein